MTKNNGGIMGVYFEYIHTPYEEEHFIDKTKAVLWDHALNILCRDGVMVRVLKYVCGDPGSKPGGSHAFINFYERSYIWKPINAIRQYTRTIRLGECR